MRTSSAAHTRSPPSLMIPRDGVFGYLPRTSESPSVRGCGPSNAWRTGSDSATADRTRALAPISTRSITTKSRRLPQISCPTMTNSCSVWRLLRHFHSSRIETSLSAYPQSRAVNRACGGLTSRSKWITSHLRTRCRCHGIGNVTLRRGVCLRVRTHGPSSLTTERPRRDAGSCSTAWKYRGQTYALTFMNSLTPTNGSPAVLWSLMAISSNRLAACTPVTYRVF